MTGEPMVEPLTAEQMDAMASMLGPLVGVSDGAASLFGHSLRISVEWVEPVEPHVEAMARDYITAARQRLGFPVAAGVGE